MIRSAHKKKLNARDKNWKYETVVLFDDLNSWKVYSELSDESENVVYSYSMFKLK